MNWIFIAILTAFFYGTYNVFIKISSGHINQILGAVILQVVAAIIGGILLIILKNLPAYPPLEFSQKGLVYAILAGIAVGLAEITSFYFFSKGISASVGIPIIIGGSVVISSIIGFVFLKEAFGFTQTLGSLLVVGGIILLTK